ncbi:hypothetical protein GGP41_001137 [Bipolaris sorokiniana]|uniref:Uncharacterized protein n=1 Tax=Cochliobolus sativus TaxID=45130 RepID=A0A8H6DRF7_COCSA|nr:hypothetical protein GGP41_001137 [Bipolaris sorokiniana]
MVKGLESNFGNIFVVTTDTTSRLPIWITRQVPSMKSTEGSRQASMRGAMDRDHQEELSTETTKKSYREANILGVKLICGYLLGVEIAVR